MSAYGYVIEWVSGNESGSYRYPRLDIARIDLAEFHAEGAVAVLYELQAVPADADQ